MTPLDSSESRGSPDRSCRATGNPCRRIHPEHAAGDPVPTSSWSLASKANETACMDLVAKNFWPCRRGKSCKTPLSPVPQRPTRRSTAERPDVFVLWIEERLGPALCVHSINTSVGGGGDVEPPVWRGGQRVHFHFSAVVEHGALTGSIDPDHLAVVAGAQKHRAVPAQRLVQTNGRRRRGLATVRDRASGDRAHRSRLIDVAAQKIGLRGGLPDPGAANTGRAHTSDVAAITAPPSSRVIKVGRGRGSADANRSRRNRRDFHSPRVTVRSGPTVPLLRSAS